MSLADSLQIYHQKGVTMRIISCVCILFLGWVSFSHAKSKLHHRPDRRFDRGTIKRVQIKQQRKKIIFSWKTPSGKIIDYVGKNIYKGFRSRLQRLLKTGKKELAVRGRYTFLQGHSGVVEPSYAYVIKRTWRGLHVVKFDGVMPLFTATILPSKAGQQAMIYEYRGIVHSQLSAYDNKLVCAYGTWFDLENAPHGIFYQYEGIKGAPLFFYSPNYRTPRSWRALKSYKARLRAFKQEKQRKKRGLLPIKQQRLVPVLSTKRYKQYYEICLKRLSAFEKRTNHPVSSSVRNLHPTSQRVKTLPKDASSKKKATNQTKKIRLDPNK